MLSARAVVLDGVPHALCVVRDITERKLDERRIRQPVEQLEGERDSARRTSRTDALLELANRRTFDDALRTGFFMLKRSRRPLSLILLDVDPPRLPA